MQSFAILGSHPELSLAEIEAVTNHKPTIHRGGVAVFDDGLNEAEAIMTKLGGTQKIGAIIATMPSLNHTEMAEFLAADLLEGVPEGKITFGISLYDFGSGKPLDATKKLVDTMAIAVKQRIQQSDRSARYVHSKEAALGSPVILGNQLITKGAEFVLLLADDMLWVGKTMSVQPFDEWSTRDFGRPRRNAKQGMLPPKLARMMLNLAGDIAGKVVLDPFCGSGTVLMEATMLHASKLVGGDIAQMAVNDTEANMKWLGQQDVDVPEYELHTSPAAELATKLTEGEVDALVTETYLGRPRRGEEDEADLASMIEYLTNLYRESFTALKRTLKPGAMLVLAAPVHTFNGKTYAVDVVGILEDIGYTHVPTSYEPLVYQHEGQLVGRRIVRFRL